MPRKSSVPASPPSVSEKTDVRTRLCPQYKVLLHNDDVTPFDFVLRDVCIGIFHLEHGRAHEVTREAHERGIALVGVYPLEQAEFKSDRARSLSRGRGYPLTLTYEPA
jgi:ATP-dependent Clp protease adaptor protein ClpS